MDKLDQLIATKQAEIDQFKRVIDSTAVKHDRALIELAALRAAAAARPVAKQPAQGPRAPQSATKRTRARLPRGGRQAGDISHEWRGVLGAAVRSGVRQNYAGFHELALSNGIDTKLPNVRERVRRMAETGLLEGSPEDGYLVTKGAIDRFNLGANREAA